MGRRGSPSSPKSPTSRASFSPTSRASLGGDASQRRRGQKAVNTPRCIAYDDLQKLLNTAEQTTATLGSVAP